jgi:hypothetical protein
MAEDEGEMPVTVVTAAVFMVLAAIGWAFLAGSYAGAHAPRMSDITSADLEAGVDDHRSTRVTPSRRLAVIEFVGNAVTQLPNLPGVVSWHFQNRLWLPVIFIVLEAGVIAGGFWMRRLERDFAGPAPSRRRPKNRGRR